MKLARKKIDEMLLGIFGRELSGVDPAESLLDQLNSLQLLAFALLVQKEFSIPVGNAEITEENFSSFDTVADFVERKLR